MRITVAGHLCVDLTPAMSAPPTTAPGRLQEVGALGVSLGGCVANTARALARWGLTPAVRADIGSDALAQLVRELVTAEGWDPRGLISVPDATTSYSVVIEPPGADRTFWHHPGANDHLTEVDIHPAGVDIIHVGYPSLLAGLRRDHGAALRSLFERAHAAGCATSLDLAVVDAASPAGGTDWGAFLDAVLPVTDIVSPSVDDLRSIASSADASWADADAAALADALVRRGAAIAMVSAGADGLRLAVGDEARLTRAGAAVAGLRGWAGARLATDVIPPPRFVSTNGAGDAASAGLLAGIAVGHTPDRALAMAATTAADAIAGGASTAEGVLLS